MTMNLNRVWRRLCFWYRNARPVSLPQSLLPALTALTLARFGGSGEFSWALGLLAVAGVGLAHLSLNLFDDYFDYRKQGSGYREQLARQGMRARTTKCPYLVSGEAELSELLLAAVGFGGAAGALGLVIWLGRGSGILLVAGLGLVLGFFYSGPPVRLSYHGLGEAVIGAVFGPLVMIGVYLAAAGELSPAIWPVALALGLLVTNIVYAHSFLDLEADRAGGKLTLAGLLHSQNARLAAVGVFSIGPFVLILCGMVLGWLPISWLIPLFGPLPLALALYGSMREFVQRPGAAVQRRWWYGPMPNWEHIKAAKLDWFMLRWFMARNLTTGFALCCMLAAIAARR